MYSALLAVTIGLTTKSPLRQDPVEVLTLELKATRCSVALAEISKLTNLKLEAAPQVANEIVLISVKGMPVRPLLTKLAYVVSGQWKQDGETFRLSADNDRRRGEAIREADAKRQSVRNDLQKRADDLKKATKGEKPDAEMFNPLSSGGKTEAGIISILRELNLADAASLEEGDRLVYSTNPTRMQRPLPGTAMSIVNNLAAAHNAEVAKMGKVDLAEEMSKQGGGEVPEFLKEMMSKKTKPIVGPISKANLVIESTILGMGVTVKLIAYDSKGNVGLSEQTSLGTSFVAQIMAQVAAKKEPKPEKETPIVLSQDSQDFNRAAQGGLARTGVMMKMNSKQLNRVMDPVSLEPLSLAISDSLLAVAKKQGKPIIAAVPDELFPSAITGQGSATVEAFERESLDGEKASIIPDPDYLLIMPSRPAQSRQRHVDRFALSTLFAAIKTKSVPSLDDLANFAVRSAPPSSNPISQSYLAMFAPTAIMQGFTGTTNWSMLRFYGQLPSGQREVLANGGRVPFNQLGPDSRATLTRLVYGGGTLDVERPGDKPKADDFFSKAIRQYGGFGGGVDFRDEPTESLPEGLPSTGVIELQLTGEALLLPTGGEDEFSMIGLGSEEMGLFKMLKETPMMQQGGEDPFKLPERAKLGKRTTLNFTFRLAQGISMAQSLQDLSVPKDARIVSMNSLPDDIQKQINAQYEKLKKSPMAAMMAMGGMGRPTAPPPQ